MARRVKVFVGGVEVKGYPQGEVKVVVEGDDDRLAYWFTPEGLTEKVAAGERVKGQRRRLWAACISDIGVIEEES